MKASKFILKVIEDIGRKNFVDCAAVYKTLKLYDDDLDRFYWFIDYPKSEIYAFYGLASKSIAGFDNNAMVYVIDTKNDTIREYTAKEFKIIDYVYISFRNMLNEPLYLHERLEVANLKLTGTRQRVIYDKLEEAYYLMISKEDRGRGLNQLYIFDIYGYRKNMIIDNMTYDDLLVILDEFFTSVSSRFAYVRCLKVDVLTANKNICDGSLSDRISFKNNTLELVCNDGLTFATNLDTLLAIEKKRVCTYCVPINTKKACTFGGNFVYSAGTKFWKINKYPLPVYDQIKDY